MASLLAGMSVRHAPGTGAAGRLLKWEASPGRAGHAEVHRIARLHLAVSYRLTVVESPRKVLFDAAATWKAKVGRSSPEPTTAIPAWKLRTGPALHPLDDAPQPRRRPGRGLIVACFAANNVDANDQNLHLAYGKQPDMQPLLCAGTPLGIRVCAGVVLNCLCFLPRIRSRTFKYGGSRFRGRPHVHNSGFGYRFFLGPQAETPSDRIKFLDGLNRSFTIPETTAVLVARIGLMLRVFWRHRNLGDDAEVIGLLASLIDPAERCLPELVTNARANGASWRRIAHMLGTSPEEARLRFSPDSPVADTRWPYNH